MVGRNDRIYAGEDSIIIGNDSTIDTKDAEKNLVMGNNCNVTAKAIVIGNDLTVKEPGVYIGSEKDLVRIGIIESPTIRELKQEIQELRTQLKNLMDMIEFHPDNEPEMEKRKEHFDGLVSESQEK